MNKTLKTRALDIDLLKTVAIISVLIIHTCKYITPVLSFDWISNVFWGSLVRAAVPVFFMCSGVLFLDTDKELPIKKLYFKYILRIIAALFFWAMVYKLYLLIDGGNLGISSLIQAVKEVLTFKHYTHFYYLHIIILFYALLPIVRVFVKNATRAELRYALIVWFVVGILYPTVSRYWPITLITGMPKQWLLNMTYSSVGYGLLGHYLRKHGISLKASIPFAAAGFAVTFGGTVVASVSTGGFDARFFEGMTVGVMLLAIGVFGIGLNASKHMGKRSSALVVYISKASFCVYLIHLLVLEMFIKFGLIPDALPLVLVPVLALLNLALCCGVYFVLSKIPIVKKWLI